MVGWHHRLNRHEFEQTLGNGEGQGKPGVMQSMESQRVRHDLETEQQAPILWLPDAKRQPFGKDHHAGKD